MTTPIDEVLMQLHAIVKNPKTRPQTRVMMAKWIQKIEAGRGDYEHVIAELNMRLLRNPSFPDDIVGWLPDDFDSDDDDTDTNIV